ncbi:hypothetical protein RTCIAT899_PA00920 (plasmid) [Rhizobium tropici CIAT 899]|nr:hypothetical protein RTCIAT899_PA00920 [Rhizobium tropici CIAT 899]
MPPQQLFPSGGLLTFTLQGPRFPLAHFFIFHLIKIDVQSRASRRFCRRHEKVAREKGRKEGRGTVAEQFAGRRFRSTAASASRPLAFAGLSAPLVLRGSNARPQLHPAARSAVREMSSEK